MKKISLTILMSGVLFAIFLYTENYKDAHMVGRIVNHTPYKTLNIMQVIREVDLTDDDRCLFNGCIIKHPQQENKFFLTYRITHNDFTTDRYSFAGILTLDNNLQNENYRIIDLISEYNLSHDIDNQIKDPEDARIFLHNDKLFLFYHVENIQKRTMFMAQLQNTDDKYLIKDIHKLTYAQNIELPQKNWTPFSYQNDLYFIYSANPTEILRYNPDVKDVEVAYTTSYPDRTFKRLWRYGAIRGGTPALYLPELNAYLTFFHSSQDYKYGAPPWGIRPGPIWRIYYMGAYIFENKPPFKILAITKYPLSFDGLYKDKEAMYHIIFPCGFVEDNDRFIVSSGLGDSKIVLLQIRKQDLYNSLTWL